MKINNGRGANMNEFKEAGFHNLELSVSCPDFLI